MNRTEFVVVTAIILFIAFALGWFAHWLLHRFTRIAGSEMGEVDRLAQSLHEAEEMRDEAILFMEQREAELGSQLAQTEAELRALVLSDGWDEEWVEEASARNARGCASCCGASCRAANCCVPSARGGRPPQSRGGCVVGKSARDECARRAARPRSRAAMRLISACCSFVTSVAKR
jgi:hypothetical protein